MSAETTPAVDSSSDQPPSAAPPPGAASPAAAGAGPLARFTRSSDAPVAPGSEQEQKPVTEQASATPDSSPATQPPGAAPGGYRPRGRGDRPKSRREKEREEDRQVDRELAAERGRGEERSFRAAVPVPNLRQRSEELEAEVEAALGGMSLDQIVAADLKTDANRLENG